MEKRGRGRPKKEKIVDNVVPMNRLSLVAPKFLNVEEAAEFLRVKVSTIYSWVHKRESMAFPVRHHGSKPVFLLDELLQWSSGQRK